MTAVAKSAALLGKVSVRLQRLSTTGCEEELPAKKTDGLDADAVADADADADADAGADADAAMCMPAPPYLFGTLHFERNQNKLR